MENEWRAHDALLFRILLKSVILDKRMGMHVAIHFHPKKQGHAFYAYLQGLGIKDKESDILTIKGKIDSLTIDANADADAVLETFNIIEDNWEQVPSLTQTEAAKIKHAIALFPKEHHANQYLSALQAMTDVGGKESTFETFVAFKLVVVERVRVHDLRNPGHIAFAGIGGRHEQHQQRQAGGANNGGGNQRGRAAYKPATTPCKMCDMACCPAEGRCCVCSMTDDEVRAMKVRAPAKFVIFVMRG